VPQSHGNGIHGDLLEEVGRAVEGIDDPRPFGCALRDGALFGDEGRSGDEGAQSGDEHALGFLVDVAYEAVARLRLDVGRDDLAELALDECTSFPDDGNDLVGH
jgi:hypothetical protein